MEATKQAPKKGKEKRVFIPGDIINIEWIARENKEGKPIRPFGRAETGIACLIDRDATGYFKPGSIWTCEVKEIMENKLIVTPLNEMRSQYENEQYKKVKTVTLKDKFSHDEKKKGVKFKNIRTQYQYKSKNELGKLTNNREDE